MNDNLNKNLKQICLITSLEKFSFHGVRFTLVLYITQHLNFSEPQSYLIYGATMTLTYCTPIFVGWMHDKFCGLRFLSLLGSLFLGFGSLIICLPLSLFFYIGIGFIILGGGTLRTTIPIMLGTLYHKEKTDKSSGFTLLYVSINVGALLSAILCGFIGEKIGWYYSFLMTSIAAFFSYILLYRLKLPVPRKTHHQHYVKSRHAVIVATFIITSIFMGIFIKYNFLVDFLILLIVALVIFWLSYVYLNNKDQQARMKKLIHLMLLQIGFFALYEQGPSSFVTFIGKFVNKTVSLGSIAGSFELPLTFFQAVDPAVNLVIGVVFSYLWCRFLLKSNSEYIKFSFGFS